MKRTALKRIPAVLLALLLATLAALPAAAAGTVRMSSTIGPIDAGIVPALVGGPFFLWLLRRQT